MDIENLKKAIMDMVKEVEDVDDLQMLYGFARACVEYAEHKESEGE